METTGIKYTISEDNTTGNRATSDGLAQVPAMPEVRPEDILIKVLINKILGPDRTEEVIEQAINSTAVNDAAGEYPQWLGHVINRFNSHKSYD
ncbi:hypothetical protein MMC21_000089 [Puttea exsequens]|nr:hypothetical protein [Puttea exsequens]